MLVADPQQRRDNIELGTILGGDMPRTQGEVEVLHKEENVGGELNSLAKTDGRRVFSRNGNEEASDLRAISIPKKQRKENN